MKITRSLREGKFPKIGPGRTLGGKPDHSTDATKGSVLYGRDDHDRAEDFNHSEFFYRIAVDQHEIVAVTDRSGKIVFVNEMFCKISQYSREELTGKDHRILNSGVHSKEFFKNMWQTIISGKTWQGDICNKAKDGSIYWVQSTIVPLFRDDGSIKNFVAIRRLITKEKLKQLKLFKLLKDANNATLAKNDFFNMIGHDIRTPLNGMLGLISPLLSTNLSPEQREYVEAIAKSGKILLHLLNDLLDLSKIDSGKMELHQEEFDFSAHLDEIVHPHFYVAGNKGVVFKKVDDYYPYMLVGDRDRIGQIVNNLLSNAIKFTSTGTVTLKTDYQIDDQFTMVSISVHDTGVGIPPAAKQRIFQEFSQADITIARKYGGSGLGLSICKKLVAMMNGNISFDSDPARGTTFRVVLKLANGKKISRKNQYVERFQKPNDEIVFQGRILVAEDNHVNKLVIDRLLHDWRCDHHIVADGHEVLDALKNQKFDLILMDCQMPVMDGFETTQMIRQSETINAAIPIIALTATSSIAEKQRCLAVGMNDYILKPIDIEKFQQILKHYLSWKLVKKYQQQCDQHFVASAGPIDINVISQFDQLPKEEGTNFVKELISTFIINSQERIAKIKQLSSVNNSQGIIQECHSMRPGAYTIGAVQLGDICQDIEELAKKQKTTEMVQKIDQLIAVHRDSCAALTIIMDRKSGVVSNE